MGDLTHIEPLTNDVIKTLRERLDDALKGDISGIVILCEYEEPIRLICLGRSLWTLTTSQA